MNNRLDCGVYRWLNLVTNELYVGSSVDMERRRRVHLMDLKKNAHCNPKFQNAWNKYGPEAFVFERMLYCTETELLQKEQMAIDILDSVEHGYNIVKVTAAPMLGRTHGDSTKKLMSDARQGKHFGPMSDEGKKNLSIAHEGLPWSETRIAAYEQLVADYKANPNKCEACGAAIEHEDTRSLHATKRKRFCNLDCFRKSLGRDKQGRFFQKEKALGVAV